ncbi:lipid II flippase MurJ [Streptosporangium lutulentum]
MVLGPAVTVMIFSWGNMTVDSAVYIGNVLQIFGLALVPFSIFQLLLRVFYSFGDTRTPVFLAFGNVAVNATLSVVAYFTLPPRYIVMGLALSFTVAYVVGTGVAWMLAAAAYRASKVARWPWDCPGCTWPRFRPRWSRSAYCGSPRS